MPALGRVASGGADGAVRMWEPGSSSCCHTIGAHPEPIAALAFDPTRGLLASGGLDGTVWLIDADSARPVARHERARWAAPIALAFDASDDGALLAVVRHVGGAVSLSLATRAASRDPTSTVPLRGCPRPQLAVFLDGGVAVVTGPAGQLFFFARDGQELARRSASGEVTALAADGTHAVVGTSTGAVERVAADGASTRLFDIGEPVVALAVHDGRAAAASGRAVHLASGGDRSVLRAPGRVSAIAFHEAPRALPEGYRDAPPAADAWLVIGDEAGGVRFEPLTPT